MEMNSRPLYNPYATALDGLKLDDPVYAFFEFCRERENIRIAREGGSTAGSTDVAGIPTTSCPLSAT